MKVEEPCQVNTRLEFARYVDYLIRDLDANPEEWENNDLKSFLEAISRYALSVHGYYKNFGIPIDADVARWRVFADILAGARVYE